VPEDAGRVRRPANRGRLSTNYGRAHGTGRDPVGTVSKPKEKLADAGQGVDARAAD
jgi:hypothetical protein